MLFDIGTVVHMSLQNKICICKLLLSPCAFLKVAGFCGKGVSNLYDTSDLARAWHRLNLGIPGGKSHF